MKSAVYLSILCGVLSTLLIVSAACSSSRKASGNDDESDSGSQSDRDGGTDRHRDADFDDDDDGDGEDDVDSRIIKSTGGSSGSSAGSTGVDEPYGVDASDAIRCDEDGICYWPDGHYCYPDGWCCYPDGHCEGGAVAGAAGVTGVAGVTGFAEADGGVFIVPPPWGTGGSGIDIDPDDFTDAPWDPPTVDLADPRWRDSGNPLCTEMQTNVTSHSVWSDSRGVYVLVSGASIGDTTYEADPSVMPDGFPFEIFPPPFSTCTGEGCPRVEIYFNDGSGWDSIYEEATVNMGPFSPGDLGLTGFDNGPLLVYGYESMPFIIGDSDGCGIATIENGVKTCEPISYVDDLFVVNNDLAYAIYDGDVIRYDGRSWGPLPGALNNNWINRIWANEAHLFGVLQGAGRIIELRDGTWMLLDTGTLDEFSSIWGFSESDLWAGTYQGKIFHCDEERCNEITWPGDNCEYTDGIREIWGSEGVVYFYTNSSIARIVDSEVEVLASFPCPDYEYDYEEVPSITSMWGNGPDEVFFTVVDESFPRRECGVAYVVWFDGNAFHQF